MMFRRDLEVTSFRQILSAEIYTQSYVTSMFFERAAAVTLHHSSVETCLKWSREFIGLIYGVSKTHLKAYIYDRKYASQLFLSH